MTTPTPTPIPAGSRIAVIGLGIMGSPIAVNLARAGFAVTGYSPSNTKTGPLIAAGGTAATSITDAITDAQTVLTMLPDSPDVQAVLGGDNGLLATLAPGTLVIDCSTIAPHVSAALADQATTRQLDLLDAPVSGGQTGAIDGTLSIMVGGTPNAFHRAAPVLTAIATTIVHVGPAGSGQTVKAANQLIVAGNIQLLAEAIVFLQAHNVELPTALQALNAGLAGSTVLTHKGASMAAHQFQPGFRAELHNKDLHILTTAAANTNTVIPLGTLLTQLMTALTARGHGHLDHTALLTLTEELSGRSA